jgi:hypothetical protein
MICKATVENNRLQILSSRKERLRSKRLLITIYQLTSNAASGPIE